MDDEHSYINFWVEAVEEDDVAEVPEEGFYQELEELGVDQDRLIASFADAGQDGYDVVAKIKRTYTGPDRAQAKITDEEFDKLINDLGQWPEL